MLDSANQLKQMPSAAAQLQINMLHPAASGRKTRATVIES
jgi:hypothetical protein